MKKAKKHNIKNISFLALTFSALCLAGCNAVEYSNSNAVEEIPQAYIMQQKAVMPKLANTTGSWQISATQQKDWYYYCTNVYGQIDNSEEWGTTTLAEYTIVGNTIGNSGDLDNPVNKLEIKTYTLNTGSIHNKYQIILSYNGTQVRSGMIDENSENSTTVLYSQNTVLTEYPEEVYNGVVNHEIPQPETPTMGEQIVDGIESGLGMIGTLASEFLAGFGALFYVENQLTQFAIFSLVFLGIAITFAIIKLCLNVVRSNTGA